jgi:hypothetical protein
MLLDVIHLGPGNVSTVFRETSEGAVVTRIVVRIVAYIRVLTKGAKIGIPRLCKQKIIYTIQSRIDRAVWQSGKVLEVFGRISADTPAILSEGFPVFPQSLQANAEVPLPSNSFIIHNSSSPYHSTLYEFNLAIDSVAR